MRWIAFRRSGRLGWAALYVAHPLVTSEQQATGLSGIAQWPTGHAAVFPFSGPGRWRVHTRGMLFPIDIVALDCDGYVIGSASGAQPNEASLFEAPDGTCTVVELAAGEVDSKNLAPLHGNHLRAELYNV